MKVETLKEDMGSETEKQKLSYLNKLVTEQIQTRSFHLIFSNAVAKFSLGLTKLHAEANITTWQPFELDI